MCRGHWVLFFLISGFLPLMSACQNYSENSLVGDYRAPSSCPPEGCVTTTATKDSIWLQVKNQNSFILCSNQTKLDIGGDCYISTFKQGIIEVSVFDASGKPVQTGAIGLLSELPPASPGMAIVDLAPPNDITVRCIGGRFQASIPTPLNAFPLPGTAALPTYKVRTSLTAYDSANNPFSAPLVSEFTFQRQGGCR